MAVSAVQARPRFFYGWWIVLAGMGQAVLWGGLYIYGFGAFFLPLVEEFGWPRAVVSGVISFASLQGGLLAPVAGLLIDRLGPRRMSVAGLIVIGLGFFLFSRVDSLLLLYVAFLGLLANGVTFGLSLPAQVAIANWFVRRRGLALGIYNAGFGLGGATVPVLVWIIATWGWRTGAIVCGIIAWSIGVPLALMLRHRPEQYGLQPDGGPSPSAATPAPTAAKALPPDAEADFTPRQVLATRTFWLMVIAWAFWWMISAIATVHMIPHLVRVGFDQQTAALIAGAFAAFSGLTRIGVAWLGDYVSKRLLLAFCMGAQSVGLAVFATATTLWEVGLFILIFAPTWGGMYPLRAAIQGEYFGRRHFGAIAGLFNNFALAGTMTGPVFAGWMFDLNGDYRAGFLIVAALNVAGTLIMLTAQRPAARAAPPEPQLRSVP